MLSPQYVSLSRLLLLSRRSTAAAVSAKKSAPAAKAAAVAATVSALLVLAAAYDDHTGIGAAHAQQEPVTITSIAVGGTTLLTIQNTGGESAQGVSTVRIWLSATDGAVFKSFKTESGWVGQKTPEGVIVFTAAIPLRDGKSAKLGVETDRPVSGVNWRTVDQNGNDIMTGRVTPSAMPDVVPAPSPDKDGAGQSDDNAGDGSQSQQPPPSPPDPPAPPPPSITPESDFRVVPAKPSVGSTIRVVGEKFGPEYRYSFYMDGRALGDLASDLDGRFVTTMRIPGDAIADRVSFAVRDSGGSEVVRSLRLNPAEQRQIGGVGGNGADQGGQGQGQGHVTIAPVPDTVKIGDRMSMSGAGVPDSTIIVYVTGPDGAQVKADVIRVDQNGIWSVPGTYLVGADMAIGGHSTTVTDGNNIAQTTWSVVQEKRSLLESTKISYDRGETMSFNYTGDASDTPVRVDLEDPKGQVVYSNIAYQNAKGTALFEYKTDFRNEEGTYTLVATHGPDKEFLFVGLGQMPSTRIVMELDKVNYRSTDTAIIDIAAKPADTLRLTILDHSDNIAHTESVRVQSDGRMVITVDLADLDDGIYTAEIEKGTEKASEEFTVGLHSGSTNIEITPIRPPYHLGERFQVSIDTGDSIVPITVTVSNPEGDMVSIVETFSDRIRVNKDDDRNKALVMLQIPSTGSLGTWMITADSGGNIYTAPIEVVPEGMSVHVHGIEKDQVGGVRYVDITVIGAKQTVWLEVKSRDGTVMGDEQKVSITDEGVASVKWAVPDGIISGTYTLHVRDAHKNTAQAEITIE